MADILQVGALIDLTQILPGLEQLTAATTGATGAMSSSFTLLGANTTTSAQAVAAATNAIPVALRAAEAEAVRAEVVVGGAMGGLRGAFSSLSATVRGAAASVSESLGLMSERVVETAETSKLEVGTMGAAFSGLSKLIGAGIAVGFAAHFLDETAEVVLQLGHLHESTGISLQTLAGLRAVAQQVGVAFEGFTQAMIRMERAQVFAVQGHKAQQAAFQTLGVSVEELKTLKPEDLFFRLAKAIADTDKPQVAAAAS